MISTSRLFAGFLCAVLLSAASAPAGEVPFDEAARHRIDAAAQRLIDEHRSPGLAIGVMRDGEIVYAKGFGLADVESGTQVTPETVFLIGSITKHFTAAAIVLLSEQGKLKIDDPISKYLPEFPRGNEVTIRQLLTHTSGLCQIMGPGGSLTPEQASKARSTDEMVALIAGLPDLYVHEPGSAFLYSNAGYWLLGAIVEKVSGETLGAFFKQNLFDRAGMKSTDLEGDAAGVPQLASGYLLADGETFNRAGRGKVIVAGGAGGIRSTIGDMLRWQEALLSGKIVSPDGVTMMTTPERPETSDAQSPEPDGARGYGFGLGVGTQNGHAYVGHTGGSSQGFSANLKAFPDDGLAFVVLTNVGPSRGGVAAGPRRRPENPADAEQGPPRRVRRPGGGQDRAAAAIERVISELVAGPPKPNPPAAP